MHEDRMPTLGMKTYRVAVIAGDGIGQEVMPEGIRVLEGAGAQFGFHFEWEHFPWGAEYYFQHKAMMPPDALEQLRYFDAIYFGAVGDARINDNITLNGLLLPIRRTFDQYACVRPAVLYPGARSPLAGKKAGDIDFVVVRENTEGEYAQVGGYLYQGSPDEVAVQTAVFTRKGTERVIRFAFELTRRRNKKGLLTSVTKSNAQGFSMTFWDRVFAEVAAEFPDIRIESLLVDAACMDLIRRPESFDVIVASNLFGDILTDIGAMISR
jgi:tartrate dehydrogenase/decarboxylase/D-malate dehydrogenase